MFSASMIGAGVHGNGRHWYSVEPEERVIAMKVRRMPQTLSKQYQKKIC